MKPKVSLWIVTYNNSEDLNNNLRSLHATVNRNLIDLEVNVINNHTNFHLDFEFLGKVKIFHNSTRSDQSLGHLARNWNQALIHGFKNLNYPAAHMVLCCQDDVLWEPHWCENLLTATKTYNFISQGHGDALVVHTPEAVKAIGLWDERFSPSFYHEGDYFLRALIYNRERTSLNDPGHGRCFNTLEQSLIKVPAQNQLRQQAKNLSYGRAELPHLVWQHKWPVPPIHWPEELIQTPPSNCLCKNFVLYPHFELDVLDLREKNYLV